MKRERERERERGGGERERERERDLSDRKCRPTLRPMEGYIVKH